jgi:hypothetical protein
MIPAATQVLALLAPFVYLRTVVVGHSAEAAVQSELVLSVATFCAIAIDWSSTTFLSRTQGRLLRSGAFFSILAGKLISALALLGLLALLFTTTRALHEADLLLIGLLMLMAIALDPSWIHVGRGSVWVPPALGAFRFFAATALTHWLHDPVMALAWAYALGSVAFLWPVAGQVTWPGRISLRLPTRVMRRYAKPTVTDLLTAGFSRLDVALAAMLLDVQQALVYAVARKLVVGLQSVAFSGARLFYLERDAQKLAALTRSLRVSSTAILLVGIPIAYLVATTWFQVPSDLTLQLTLAFLGLLLPLGYFKTLIQFSGLYRSGSYSADLAYTVLSVMAFAGAAALFALTDMRSAAVFALVRLSADLTYVGMAALRGRQNHAT